MGIFSINFFLTFSIKKLNYKKKVLNKKIDFFPKKKKNNFINFILGYF